MSLDALARGGERGAGGGMGGTRCPDSSGHRRVSEVCGAKIKRMPEFLAACLLSAVREMICDGTSRNTARQRLKDFRRVWKYGG